MGVKGVWLMRGVSLHRGGERGATDGKGLQRFCGGERGCAYVSVGKEDKEQGVRGSGGCCVLC